MGRTLQFAELLEEGFPRLNATTYVTTGSHNTFGPIVRAHGRSPTCSLLLCSLLSNALGLPLKEHFDFPPRKGMGRNG